ncbi:hypothetical protein TUM3794_21280 [Shewanella colwelliana]|uniref:Uncharacterized protein n=1 Tax=Shewanella colwelliana TaxID=23 RepID=A0ABQ4P149_SHECO|nr:hypothetical protein [Shewanella colwelliana]GIU41204.1 hypothetical protein TUM3794_21280 [Shewanella colwelliana]
MESEVNGFTNAAMTWMSESGHAINVRSRICTGLLALFDLTLWEVLEALLLI